MIATLTTRQRKFLEEYCRSHSLTKAAKYAGCKCKDVHSYSSTGWSILKSLELTMPELLDAQGITDDFANEILLDGLQATRTEIATYKGKIADEKEYLDRPTRAKYLEIFHKLRGNFIDRHELTGRDGGEIILTVNKASGKAKQLDID